MEDQALDALMQNDHLGFRDMIRDNLMSRLGDRLDDERAAVANSIFGGEVEAEADDSDDSYEPETDDDDDLEFESDDDDDDSLFSDLEDELEGDDE